MQTADRRASGPRRDGSRAMRAPAVFLKTSGGADGLTLVGSTFERRLRLHRCGLRELVYRRRLFAAARCWRWGVRRARRSLTSSPALREVAAFPSTGAVPVESAEHLAGGE